MAWQRYHGSLVHPGLVQCMAILSPGDILLDRYRIESLLGSGGMAHVYEAYDKEGDRSVALKMLDDDFGKTDVRRQRFLQEFSLLSRFQHPDIVSVYDQHETPDGRLFFTMEKISGKSLADVIKTLNPSSSLSTQDLINILIDIAHAVHYVHSQKIIYRDLKPDNVILLSHSDLNTQTEVQPGRRIKLIDFGISISSDAQEDGHNSMPGTTAYMSPEQIRGQHIDFRADVYSFGILAFELFTKKLPFECDSANTMKISQLIGEIPSVSQSNPEASQALERMISICMQKKAEHRYSSLLEVIRRLENESVGSRKNGGLKGVLSRLFGLGLYV